jgi:hypothetical protein
MKYKVLKQDMNDERLFDIQDENGYKFKVDLCTDGVFVPPVGVEVTPESWRRLLRDTFLGKTMEIERLTPYGYCAVGKQEIL